MPRFALPDTFVVDCSIVAAAFLADDQSPLAAEIRERCGELTLIAPRVLRLEFLNIALGARRRGRLDEVSFVALLDQGAQFPVTYDDADSSLIDFGQAAYRLGLTSYDYAYLDCARRRGLPLATLDRALLAACASAGIRTLPPAVVTDLRPGAPARTRRAR